MGWKQQQERSLETAANWGKGWTSEELELVVTFGEEPVVEVARALGRTVYAVSTVRGLLEAGQPVGGGNGRKPEKAEPSWDFVTTFPPGWND
jgi:hypothetical protein